MKQVLGDVTTKPLLQPLKREGFNYKTVKVGLEVRADISATVFWNKGQKSFFHIRIFSSLAPCCSILSLEESHAVNEIDKIRRYGERIINVEQGTFTPLAFTSARGMVRQSDLL